IMPAPRATNAPQTEVLPATQASPTGEPSVQSLPQRRTPWFVYALIALLSVLIGGGAMALLKSSSQRDSVSPAAPLISNTGGNENKQAGVAQNQVASNSAASTQATSSPSPANPAPTPQLVGTWQGNFTEANYKFQITVTFTPDGKSKIVQKDSSGRTYKLSGTWRLDNGLIYETFSNGTSAKGSIEWIDIDTYDLTIIDNGEPIDTGRKRRYHRIGPAQ
ncbi:MAG: hypothetical protein ICV60_15130, partial [Pyrinomonadaceae bacterium]|nr:hypothetical protein [Pyrinomonadaceae bacterium]